MKTTRRSRQWPGILIGAALLCLLPLPSLAQNARLQLDNLEKLSSKASGVNDIMLDGPMLQLAAKFVANDKDEDEGPEVASMLRDLKGIYIKNFEFDQPNQYSPGDVASIRSQLAAPGWTRIVHNRNQRNHATDEVYIMRDGNKVAGVAILVVEPKELTVVNIVGPIDLDKLSLLDGKFGIPDEDEKPKHKHSGESPHEKNDKDKENDNDED